MCVCNKSAPENENADIEGLIDIRGDAINLRHKIEFYDNRWS